MIVFVDYLYKEIGGVGQLVINTVCALNNISQSAKVFCSKESYEYKGLISNNASFIHIDSDTVPLDDLGKYLEKDDVILLTHINNTPLLEAIKHIGNKLLFYSVHPDTFFVYNRILDFLCLQKKEAVRLVNQLENKNGLIFMDYPNVEGVNNRGCKLDYDRVKYLPISVPSCGKIRNKRVNNDEIHITYMGRGNADWKIYPVVKILKDLQATQLKVKLTIITDKNDLYRTMIQQSILPNSIVIDYENGLSGERLQKYLMEKSDLHFAMGTSALEAAKLGIPTIVLDISYKVYPENYKYKWMYESKGFSLANNITNETSFEGRSMSEILDVINDPIKYSNLSELNYEYVRTNHFIESYIDNLLKYVGQTEMTVKDYCDTRFSRNMKNVLPIVLNIGKIKRFVLRQNS